MTTGLRVLVTLFSINALVAALDYATGNDYQTTPVESPDTLPLVWALSLTAVGVLSLAGVWTRFNGLAKIGALAGTWTYLLFAFTVWDHRMWPVPWPPEDIRLPFNHATTAAVWLLVVVLVVFRQHVERDKEIIREDFSHGGVD